MAIDKIDSNALDTNIDVSGSVTADSINLNAGYGSDAAIYGVRAWVNFDGSTNVAGNCTIRASGNVSSVADNGTGDYTVNFTSAMPDANFAVSGFTGNSAFTNNNVMLGNATTVYQTSSVRIKSTIQTNNTLTDMPVLNITIYR